MKKPYRFLALCLCLVLLVSAVPVNYAYAGDLANSQATISNAKINKLLGKDSSSASVNKAKKDILLLDSLNVKNSYLTNISEDSNGLTYTYSFPNITSEVNLEESSEGTTMYIREGEKYNELLITDTGEIYLDGFKVTISPSVSCDDNNEFSIKSESLKGSVFDDSYSATCPYGTESNYNLYSTTYSNADVALGQALMSLTFLAFNTIFSTIIPAWAAVALSVAEIAFNYFVDNEPYSVAASYKDFQYTHYNGYWVTNYLAVQKCSIYLFADKNYSGPNWHETTYYSHEFTG